MYPPQANAPDSANSSETMLDIFDVKHSVDEGRDHIPARKRDGTLGCGVLHDRLREWGYEEEAGAALGTRS